MIEDLNIPLSFPFSQKDFIAYQEKLSKRSFTSEEKSLILSWLEVINTARPEDIELIDHLIKGTGSTFCMHFLEAVKAWINYVLMKGFKCE